jgi:hypothetical protein
MKRLVIAALAGVALTAAACRDTSAPSSQLAITMASAFSAAPTGFSSLTTSFDAGAAEGPFQPGFGPGADHGDHGRGGFGPPGIGPGFGLGFMGGGLFGSFLGDGPERFFHADSSCSYSSSTGVTCGPVTRDGLTVTRVSKYTTIGGQTQPKIDSTTNTVVSTITVKGTSTRHDSTVSVVDESSSQTISGLALGSTKRTVNGASAGTESTTGTSKEGAFTSNRVTGDTVTGIVIPVPATKSTPTYPTAGTVIRAMSATVTISGQSPAASSRREVITYNGTATATVVITQDGTTQTCTLPLPHGRLVCP